jgi:hypothetical protein
MVQLVLHRQNYIKVQFLRYDTADNCTTGTFAAIYPAGTDTDGRYRRCCTVKNRSRYITGKWYSRHCKLGRIQKHKYIIVMYISGEGRVNNYGMLKGNVYNNLTIRRPPFRSFCLHGAFFLCKPHKEGSGGGGGFMVFLLSFLCIHIVRNLRIYF